MNNLVAKGDRITATAGGTITGGKFQVLDDRALPAMGDASSGETYELLAEGIVSYACEGETIALGEKLYYDASNDILTKTASSHKPAGWAASVAATTAVTEITCKLGAW
jgi:predicted RecA/RadA family phage recombinase